MSDNYDGPLMAQQILRLRAERDALKAALEKIVDANHELGLHPEDLREIARAALKAREVKP